MMEVGLTMPDQPAEGALLPAAFAAVTVQEYARPLVRPREIMGELLP